MTGQSATPGPAPGTRIAGAPRLRPGAILYEVADGTWRCWTGESFLRVDAPPACLRALQPVLHGAADTLEPPGAAGDGPSEQALADLVEAFRDQGLLARQDDRPVPGPRPQDSRSRTPEPGLPTGLPYPDALVHVEGETPLADFVAGQLGEVARVTRGSLPMEDVPAGLAALVSCEAWLPDARWQRLDRWSAENGVAWHTVHAEGEALVVGPCSLPGRRPRYHDARARRLAAAAFPGELLGLWQALDRARDGGRSLPPQPRAGATVCRAVAGLVRSDLTAWLEGRQPPGAGVQAVVDGRSGRTSRHTVLPLPDLSLATS